MVNIIKQEISFVDYLKKKLEFICDFCNTTARSEDTDGVFKSISVVYTSVTYSKEPITIKRKPMRYCDEEELENNEK